MAGPADSHDRASIELPPGTRGVAAMALALGTFMQVLDTTIANVSLPTIAGSLGVSPHQGTWVVTSFAVANGISVPLTGWLMQRYGVVRTFVTCVLLFTLASFLCGIAWSFESLIAFRVLQGAVSGPMIPGSQSLLMSIFPPSKRGFGLGLWSMTTLVAPIAGPLLGGYISDNYTWPWIFLINLPFGLLTAAICWGILKDKESPTRKLPVDVIGVALLVAWVGALQVLLDTGKDLDWFESTQIVVLAIVAAIGFCAFLIWELGDDHPIVDLSFFRSHNYRLGMIVSCLGYAVFFGNVVILPLWLQTQLGYTATWAGIVQSPSGMVAVLLSPYVGRRLQDYDARRLATVALVALALSLYMRAQLNSQAALGDFIAPMLVQGVGLSFFFVSVMTIQYDGLTPHRLPAATGLANFLRITAGAFSTSIATTVWEDRATLHQSRLAEASSAYDPTLQHAMASLHGTGMGTQQSIGALTRGAIEQSYMLSSLDYFWVSAWIMLAMVALVWLARRPQMGPAGPVAAD